ncbi:MAG TPA: hypothetical protein VGM88_06970 [Kofleriaceae bacterium]|jgi:hypothetical protein
MRFAALCLAFGLAATSCGGGRATQLRYPGAPAAFDRSASDAKALEIADKVFAAAGGPGHWDAAKQLKWHQVYSDNGQAKLDGEVAWDRWNARHWAMLHRADGMDASVGYEIYGEFMVGQTQPQKEKMTHPAHVMGHDEIAHGVEVAKKRFNSDTGLLALQFVMLDPGATIKYVGPAKDVSGNETGDELLVTFSDPARKDTDFHPVVDRTTNLITRIEMTHPGTTERSGYSLDQWTTVGGLKFATARKDLATSETVAITDLTVGAPDDNLFIAPVGG